MGNNRNPNSWTPTPIRSQSLSQLAITTGRNQALAEFYQLMLDRRWSVRDDRRDHRQDMQRDWYKNWLAQKGDGASASSPTAASDPATSDSSSSSHLNMFEQARSNLMEHALSSTDSAVGKDNIIAQSGIGSWAKTLEANKVSLERHAGESDKMYYDRLVKMADAVRKEKLPTDEQQMHPDNPSGQEVSDYTGVAKQLDYGKGGLVNSALHSVFGATEKVMGTDPAQAIYDSKGAAVVGDGLLKVLDVISRPAYATSGFFKAITDDKNRVGPAFSDGHDSLKTQALLTLGTGGIAAPFVGMNYLMGEDPLTSNPLGVFSAAPWQGAWAGLSGKDKTTFSEVIAQNAGQDPNQTASDSKAYQIIAGLGGDLLYDPLNFVGVGAATSPVKVGRDVSKVSTLAKDLEKTKALRNAEGDLLTSDDIFHLLGGYARNPATAKERNDLYKYVSRNTNDMQHQLKNIDVTNWSNKKASKLDELRAKLATEREVVVGDNGRDTFLGELRYQLGIDEASGTLDAGAVDSFDRMISDIEIGKAFSSDRLNAWRRGVIKGKTETKSNAAKSASEATSKRRYAADVEWRKANHKDPISYEAWINEHKPFHEALGKAWTGDYRLTDAERTHLFDTAETIAAREDSGYRGLVAQSMEINKGIQADEKLLNSGSLTAEQAKATRGRIRAAKEAKKNVDSKKDQVLGQIFGTYVDHYIRTNRSGEQFFKDTTEAQRLLAMRSEVEAKLSDQASNVSYTGLTGDAPSDLTQSLDPVPGFLDSHSHYAAAQSQIDKRLNDLSAVIGDGNTKIVTTPPEYLKDGSLDESMVKNGLSLVDGQIVSRDPNDAFLGSVARYLNDRTSVHTKRLLDKANRPINEVVSNQTDWRRVEAAATKGDSNAKHVLDMFDRYGDREGLFPFVKVGDEKVFLATGPKFEAAMAKHVIKMDSLKADRLKTLITSYSKDTKFSKSQAEFVKRTLMADGKLVPAYRGGLKEFLLKNHAQVKDLFTPERVAFERLFGDTHNLSLAEAMNMRDRAIGRVVTGSGSNWKRKFPEGLTLQEFSDKVTASKDSLREVLIGGPFDFATGKIGGWAKYRNANKSKKAVSELENEWVNGAWKSLISSDTDASSIVARAWKTTYGHVRTALEQGARNVARSEGRLTPAQTEKIKFDARNAAWDDAKVQLDTNQLKVSEYDTSFNFKGPVSHNMNEDELFDALKFRIGDKAAEDIKAARMEFRNSSDQKISSLSARIKAIDERKAVELAKLRKAKKVALESRKVMIKRLDEDAVFQALSAELSGTTRHLTLVTGQQELKIPGSQALFEAMDAASGFPLIKYTRELFAKAFVASSDMPFELQLARQRALANTPNIIAMHVKELKDTLGKFSTNERAATFRGLLTGGPVGNPELADQIKKQFDQLLPYFNLKVKDASGRPLTIDDIMKYAPDEYTLVGEASRRTYGTVRELMNALNDSHTLRNKALAKRGQPRIKKDADAFDDPIKVLWNMRIAIEQAMARRALIHTVNNAFGVPRAIAVNGKYMIGNREVTKGTHDMVESLHDKGWRTVDELGGHMFFPPESHADIEKLFKMLDPREINKVGKIIDYANRIWKTTVTIYNPGYYTRNAIGETMASWFAGVSNPKYYRLAREWVKYARNEGSELAALKSHFPMLEYTPSGSAKANHIAATTKSGRKISYEQLNVMYHDQGLKTGFIRTEYDTHFSKAGQAVRDGGGNVLSKGHNKLRDFGEWYEDYFRMAHFMHEVEHAPRTMDLQQIAEHAARQVRKYHFDYSDFTNFEKTVMLRAFPFYKWTRKALPLMATMMFQKPGKVLAYPKIMHAANEATINTGDMQDANQGFMPVYAGIVPGWMQDMWAYKISEDQSAGAMEGAGTYFNMATPQMDIYKQTADPVGSAYTLANPFVKALAEQSVGRTNLAGEGGMSFPLETKSDRGLQLLRNTGPQGAFIAKLFGKDNPIVEKDSNGAYKMDQALLSFLTGLGFYENDRGSQIGEIVRRNGG